MGLRSLLGLDASERASAPATPPTGRRLLYPKSDGWYERTSAGTETKLSTLALGSTSTTAAAGNHSHTGYAATSHTHAEADITNLVTDLGNKADAGHTHSGYESAITAGTTGQYWRGDKTWQDLNTAVDARVEAVAHGYVVCTSTTRPAHLPGRTIYETDTDLSYVSISNAWVPKVVRLRLERNANQVFTSATVDPITFNVEVEDPEGMFTAPGTVVTFTRDGWVSGAAGCRFLNNATGGRAIHVERNGTRFAESGGHMGLGNINSGNAPQVAIEQWFAAGDTLRVTAIQNSGGNLAIGLEAGPPIPTSAYLRLQQVVIP